MVPYPIVGSIEWDNVQPYTGGAEAGVLVDLYIYS